MKKHFSLIATIAVIIIAAIGGYYLISLKQSEYPVSTFVAIDYKWGVGDTLANHYNSVNGNYQYLNNRDSLVKTKVKLRANNIIYIHSKANELGLWQLPDVITNPNADLKSNKVLRYEFIFTYEQKTKKIIYLTDYNENTATAHAADELQKIVKSTIDEAEDRYSKF